MFRTRSTVAAVVAFALISLPGAVALADEDDDTGPVQPTPTEPVPEETDEPEPDPDETDETPDPDETETEPDPVGPQAVKEDPRYNATVLRTECTGEVDVIVSGDTADTFTIDWDLVIRDTDQAVRSGTLEVVDGTEVLGLTGVARGAYDFVTYADGPDTVTTSTELEVLGCVTVDTACQSVVLTNPADNPALEVQFGDGIWEGGATTAVSLDPGQTRTIRYSYPTMDWRARHADFAWGSPTFGAGHQREQVVPQDCGAPPMLTAEPFCDGGTEQVRLVIDHLPEEAVGYLLGDSEGFHLVRSHDENGRTQDTYVETVRRPGLQQYEIFLNHRSFDLGTFEQGEFEVPACQGGALGRTVRSALPTVGADDVRWWLAGGALLLVAGGAALRLGKREPAATARRSARD